MNSPFAQLSLIAETDLRRLHTACLQVAEWAGLPFGDQLLFSHQVVEKCKNGFQEKNAGIEVLFTLHNSPTPQLKATIKQNRLSPQTIEISLPMLPDTDKKPTLKFNITAPPGWQPDYRDLLYFNFALSHDLKNSLAKLKLALSLLNEHNIPTSLEYYVNMIHRASVKMENTMAALNQLLQLGHGADEVVQSLSPEVILEEVLTDFPTYATVIKSDFGDVDRINYIEVYLKNLFYNLLSNAIKYASPNRPLVIDIKVYRENNFVVLEFTDNGEGIDLARHGAKIFQPFTRFSKQAEGTGIGLYLMKTMVERNGGKIELESELDKGTTFRFFLQEYDSGLQ